MKKISIIASTLVLFSTILSADITIKNGWQLLGATQDINTSIFDSTCVDYIWKYDTSDINNLEWQIHIANAVNYNQTMPEITSLTKGEGYWVKGNADCNITVPETLTHDGVTYGTVVSPFTGKVWLDRNLGAARVCTAFDDNQCYGDYYQWGRGADGHEKSSSNTTDILATDIINVGIDFIIGIVYPGDWTTADSNGSLRSIEWSKTDGTSICPIGYRAPTIDELKAETILASTAVTDGVTAFDNFLKLPSAGRRFPDTGLMNNLGIYGNVWSSSVSSSYSSYVYFGSPADAGGSNAPHAYGYSVRCIRN